MSEAVDIVAQLNASWRIIVALDQVTWRRRSWVLQQLVEDVWCDRAAARTGETLRSIALARAGSVDADAAAILDALPPRVDLRSPWR
jgi:hypothetical protein